MRGEAAALNGIGAVRYATGDCRAAAAMLWQALSLFRAIGDASGEDGVPVRLALVQIVTGDHARSTATLDLAMAGSSLVPETGELLRPGCHPGWGAGRLKRVATLLSAVRT